MENRLTFEQNTLKVHFYFNSKNDLHEAHKTESILLMCMVHTYNSDISTPSWEAHVRETKGLRVAAMCSTGLLYGANRLWLLKETVTTQPPPKHEVVQAEKLQILC